MKKHAKSGEKMTPREIAPREIALSYMASFASGDPDKIVSHLAEDFRNNQTGALGKSCTGREVYRERLVGFLDSFRNLRYQPEEVVAEGQRVAVTYRMRAEADGKPIDIPGVMMITVADGKITSRSDYWDGLSYLKQTGKSA